MAASGDHQIELALATPEGIAAAQPPAASAGSRRRIRTAPVESPVQSPPAISPEAATMAEPAAPSVLTQPPGAEHLVAPAPAAAASVLADSGDAPRLHWLVRRMRDIARLMRLDRPIGIWLLLWPEAWALWIASAGHPQRRLLAIFGAGTVLMRSAGCIINDLTDRNIDPHVKRTRARPLAARVVGPYEAIVLFATLSIAAGLLALQLNAYTLRLAFVGVALTTTYPLLKRFFPLPQLYLGLCFGWAVPMAFAATQGEVPRVGWLILVAAVLWAGVYDTMYAMADRDDDVRIGVQSSAILFGDLDRFMIGAMQLMMLFALVLVGRSLHFGEAYGASLIAGGSLFLWQQWLIRTRDRESCLQAFLNNRYFGAVVFTGILLEYTSG